MQLELNKVFNLHTLNYMANDDIISTNKIANNLTTTSSGYVLDARQGKTLSDALSTQKINITTATISTKFNNSAVGSGSVTSVSNILTTVPKSSSSTDIVFTRVNFNSTTRVISIDAYRLTGAITATVDMSVSVFYRS